MIRSETFNLNSHLVGKYCGEAVFKAWPFYLGNSFFSFKMASEVGDDATIKLSQPSFTRRLFHSINQVSFCDCLFPVGI